MEFSHFIFFILVFGLIYSIYELRRKITFQKISEAISLGFYNMYMFFYSMFIPKNPILNAVFFIFLLTFFQPIKIILIENLLMIDEGWRIINNASFVIGTTCSFLYVCFDHIKNFTSKNRLIEKDYSEATILLKIMCLGILFSFFTNFFSLILFGLVINIFGIQDQALFYLSENLFSQVIFAIYCCAFSFIPVRYRNIFLFNFDTLKFNDFDFDDCIAEKVIREERS